MGAWPSLGLSAPRIIDRARVDGPTPASSAWAVSCSYSVAFSRTDKTLARSRPGRPIFASPLGVASLFCSACSASSRSSFSRSLISVLLPVEPLATAVRHPSVHAMEPTVVDERDHGDDPVWRVRPTDRAHLSLIHISEPTRRTP